MTKVYGTSDDLVEIENAPYPNDEVACYDADVIIEFADGTEIKVHYGKPGMGVWMIEILKTGTSECSLNLCENENDIPYSDVFVVDAEYKTHRVVDW